MRRIWWPGFHECKTSWTMLRSRGAEQYAVLVIYAPIGHGHMVWVNLFTLNPSSIVREQDTGDLDPT